MAMKAGTCTYVTCVYMWLTTLHLARLHVHQGQVHVRDMYILLCISHLAVPLLRYSGPDITIPTNFVELGCCGSLLHHACYIGIHKGPRTPKFGESRAR